MVHANTAEPAAQACSYCHSRKIRCVPTGKAACRACERNSIKCRARHPKKLGRPRGASHSTFSVSQEPSNSRERRPSRPTQPSPEATSPSDLDKPPKNNTPHGNYFEMADPFVFALPSPGPSLQTLSRTSTGSNCWHGKPPSIMRQNSQTDERCLNTPETSLSPLGEPSLAETEASILPTPIMAFPDMFPHTPPIEASSPTGEPTPSILAIFNTYMEVHEALNEIRAGTRQIFIDELKDGRGAMRAVIRASELGAAMMNMPQFLMHSSLPLPATSEQPTLFSFVTILKGCELADVIATMILPPARTPSLSSPMELCGMDPLFDAKPMVSPIDDYVWPSGGGSPSAVPGSPPKLSDEHITALIRLDIHLSHLNRFIAAFAQLTAEQSWSSNTAVTTRYRRRLSHIHAQIRSAVDSTMPAWD